MSASSTIDRSRMPVLQLGIVLGSTLLLTACFGNSSSDDGDDFSQFYPATLDCETVADTPSDIFDADVSQTPRVRRPPEILALEATGDLVASEAMYNRVTAEMTGITSRFPESTVGRVRSCRPPSEIDIYFDEESWEQLFGEGYDAWDELNDFLKVTSTQFDEEEQRARLNFSGRYNINRLKEEYIALEGIVDARHIVQNEQPEGEDICLAVRGDMHFYIFRQGSNCTSSGCLSERFFAVQSDASGNFSQVGHWHGSGEAPMWFDNAEDCRVFLSGQGSF